MVPSRFEGWLGSAACVALTLMTIFMVVGATTAAPKSPPHIVFIVADDLGWNDVGFRGTRIKTPNLDALAKGGIILDQYYVQPVCSPSRASFMTGRYPFRYGLQHYVLQGGHDYGLNLNETMLPEKLKEGGYMTHAVGKWHLGMCSWQHTPTFRGFDSYFGFYGGGEDYYTHEHGGYDMRRDKQPNCGEGCSESAYEARGKYSTTLFTEEAVRVVQEHDTDKPLFLYVPFQAVHAPDEVPDSYVKPYEGVIADPKRRTFAGMLSALDEGVGNITKALMTKGLWDNLVLVFSTDNGGPIAAPGCPICGDHTGANNYPLRGGKHTLWEGGVRGTAFVHSKLLALPGSKASGLMHAVDWFPTFLELAGVDPVLPPGFPLDGMSQWSMLNGSAAGKRDEIVHNIDPLHNVDGPMKRGGGGDAALRKGDWKLMLGAPGPPDVWSADPGINDTDTDDAMVVVETQPDHLHERLHIAVATQNTTVQLFNVTADPREMHNLAAENQDVVKALLSRLTDIASSAAKPLFSFGPPDPKSNVKLFNQTWTPWAEKC